MNNLITKESMNSMSLEAIENYGSDIQLTISDQMTSMLKHTKAIDLDQTGKSLSDLSVETGAISKKMSAFEKFPVIFKTKKWLAKYDDVEGRINSLETGIEMEKTRLNTTLNSLYESLQFMQGSLKDLESCQAELEQLVDYYKENDADGLKLQASVHRLQIITTTVAVVKQECAKTILIIKENKEVTSQLAEAADNLIPIFKVMMMNVLGAKTNAEAVKLKKNLSKVANKVIIENAKQIEQTAEDLIRGREEPLISAKTVQEANSILQNAIAKVQSSALSEVSSNMDSIAQLQDSITKINSMSLLTVTEEVSKDDTDITREGFPI